MDMKKILQALDGAAAKPVEGANDMKKFVSIIQEGANPHKVSLPVQMVMQHYSAPVEKKPQREPMIKKFFQQVEDEVIQEKANKRQLINQYASVIAERVRLKESTITELSNEKLGQYKKAAGAQASAADKAGDYEKGNKRFKGIVKATIKQGENDTKKNENFNPNVSPNPGFAPGPGGPGLMPNESSNPEDTVTLDVPLLIRIMEYAREDAKDDMALHDMAENLVNLSASGKVLSMEDYNKIIPSDDVDQTLPEGKKIKPKKKTNPCWDGYQQLGMKPKGGKQVPNCVKK